MRVRVFEGSDCVYRYVAGVEHSTDAIVWGTLLYAITVKWKPLRLEQVLMEIARHPAKCSCKACVARRRV